MVSIAKKAYLKFNGGLISKDADARIDIGKFHYGLEEAQNIFPLLTGPGTKRGGFKRATAIVDSNDSNYNNYDRKRTSGSWSDEGSNVWSLSLDASFSEVWFNGTKGTEESAQVDVGASNEWYYDADNDILYVYSTSDPATAFTTPGVEYDIDPIGVVFPFAFTTEESTTTTGNFNVYILAFLWNHSTGKSNVIIYEPDGTEHTNLVQDVDEADLPFTQASIPNIRLDQKGDIIYFVDSNNSRHKLYRTGTAGSYTFQIQQVPFIDEPFNIARKINYKTWDLTQPAGNAYLDRAFTKTPEGHPDDAKALSLAFDGTHPKQSEGIHNEDVENALFLSFGDVGNHGQDRYDWFSDLEDVAFRVVGDFWVSVANQYSFSINSDWSCDAAVDTEKVGAVVASVYGYSVVNALGASEFNNFGVPKSLTVGLHQMVVHAYQFDSGGWGVTVAWRIESDDSDADGIDRDYDDSGSDHSELTLNSREWNGRSCYEIEIELQTTTTFRWRIRRRDSTMDDTNAFGSYEASDVSTNVGNPITLTADIEYNVGVPSASPTSLPNTNLAIIQFAAGSSAGDIYRFHVGFERMPLSIFEQVDPALSDTFPYTVKFAKGRLNYGGTDNHPFRMWSSQSSLYENFTRGDTDDFAIETDALGARLDRIRWLAEMQKIIVGTNGGIHFFPVKDDLYTPKNSQGLMKISIGSGFVNPAFAENILYFVGASGADLYSLSFDDLQGHRIRNETAIVPDMFSGDKIKEIEYQQGIFNTRDKDKLSCIWCLTDAGLLKCLVFDTGEAQRSWCEMSLGGITNLSTKVHSITSIPLWSGQRLYALVNRLSLGITLEYIDSDAFTDHEITIASPSSTAIDSATEYLSLSGTALAGCDDGALMAAWTETGGRVYPLTLQSAAYDKANTRITVSKPTVVNYPGAGSTDKWDDIAPTITVYVGLYYESLISPYPPEFEVRGGTTQELVREWSDPFVRFRNSLGRYTLSRLADTSREIPLVGGNLQNTDYLDNDEGNPKDISFIIYGVDQRGSLRLKSTSPTPMKVLMIGGMVHYGG
jgi:hypothetical protein